MPATGPFRTPPALAGVLAALTLSGGAQADEYIGILDYNPGTGLVQIGGRSPTPASYTVGSGPVMATSMTLSAGGGSALTYAAGVEDAQGALAVVRYNISALGPAGGPVPVRVLATGWAEGTGLDVLGNHLYFASAGFTLRTDVPVFADTNTNRGDGRQTFTIDTIAYLMPNIDYAVDLRSSAGAGGIGVAATARAFADPVFTIDPAFASLYRLAGVPTAATGAVPEPATWALMIAGFGLAGTALRRRRGGGLGSGVASPNRGAVHEVIARCDMASRGAKPLMLLLGLSSHSSQSSGRRQSSAEKPKIAGGLKLSLSVS